MFYKLYISIFLYTLYIYNFLLNDPTTDKVPSLICLEQSNCDHEQSLGPFLVWGGLGLFYRQKVHIITNWLTWK